MYNEVAYSKEGKEILDLYEKMTPWDRIELMSNIAFHLMSGEEYYDSFIKDTEYDNTVNEEHADIVSEVINQDLEDDVLDAIDNDKIVKYVCDNGLIEDLLKEKYGEETVTNALNELSVEKMYNIIFHRQL